MPHLRRALNLSLISLISAVALLPYITSFPSVLVDDDGYFYAKIAENIAVLHKATFDGIHTTSGFHLLWAGVLALTARLVLLISSSRLVLLCAFLFVNLLITYGYVFRFFTRSDARLLALVLSAVASFFTEMSLLVLLLLTLFHWFLRSEGGQTRASVPWPVLVSLFLIPLTRIDAITMLFLPLAYCALKERRVFVRMSIPVLLGIGFHLALMMWLFGKPYSVSSYLKEGQAAVRVYHNLFERGMVNTVRNALVLGMAAVAAAIWLRRRSARLGIVILSALALYGPHLVVSELRHWYFLPAYLTLAYVIFRYRNDLPLQRLHSPAVSVIAAFLVLSYGLGAQVFHQDNRLNSQMFVAEVNRVTSQRDVIFQLDWCGFTGWFLNAHVVNGDGLVNTYEYADRMRNGELAGYLDEIGARYIIANQNVKGDNLIDFHGLIVPLSRVEKLVEVPLPPKDTWPFYALYRLKD